MAEPSPGLTDNEKLIFQAIDKSDVALLQSTLCGGQSVNICDENLMTPVQQAAYKGNADIVRLLIDQGADVNICRHEHGYTSLHFAALSGNADVCRLLLMAGVKPQLQNTVGRTAAQMAAFVGNHLCVATINNFVPKHEIDYFAGKKNAKNEPILPESMVEAMHRFVMEVNVHPVGLLLALGRSSRLLERLRDVRNVLEQLCEREMKKGVETNEIMSFKYHYLYCLATELDKFRSGGDKQAWDCVESLIKRFLKPSWATGSLDYMDGQLREWIRSFPFKETAIFRQMVSSLAGKEPPPAVQVVTTLINGQRGFVDNLAACEACSAERPPKKCSRCKLAQYCDKECQRLHWSVHRRQCGKAAEAGPTGASPDPQELTAQVQNLLVRN